MYGSILIQNGFRWTAEELQKVIDMLRRPKFDSAQTDPDLHKRVNKAIEDGRIKCFNTCSTYTYVLVRACPYLFILVCTSTCSYILVCIGMY